MASVFILISKKISRDVNTLKIKHKIQKGKITYSDLNTPAKPLFSKRYRISGKPDYMAYLFTTTLNNIRYHLTRYYDLNLKQPLKK